MSSEDSPQTAPPALTVAPDASAPLPASLPTLKPNAPLPDSVWVEAARQLAFYELDPQMIAPAIDTMRTVAMKAQVPCTLEEVTNLISIVAVATCMLREQATIYASRAEAIGTAAAETARYDAAVVSDKPLSDAALKRISDTARVAADAYVALLSAETTNGETILKALRRVHATRIASGDPTPEQTPPVASGAKQVDLNAAPL